VKNLCWICFEKFGSLEYNAWTIVSIACLWLVQSVDTARAQIYYIYNLPNLSKIKFLANLLAGLRGSRDSGTFPGESGFPGYSGPSPESPGCKGINTLLPQPKVTFYHLSQFDRTPSSLVASLSPPSSPWVIFVFHHQNQVWVRDWRLQGVEIEDLLKIRRIEVSPSLSPRYLLRNFSRSTSLGLFLSYPLRE
jgi:hypothetical protein